MAGSWSQDEVDRTVDVYFSMLSLELDGEKYSKAERRRELMKNVHRSNGSIEFKFQNISAVLLELGAVPIVGYKPAVNVQALLRERVTERFGSDSEIRQKMLRAVEAPAQIDGTSDLGEAVAPPDAARFPRRRVRRGVHVDFQTVEAANRELGMAGERLVLEAERRRLQRVGRPDLAERVRHVSLEDGDGLGYDVASWTATGEKRFLEVKTTRYNEYQPFLVSRNEVEFSVEESARFALVRVFGFSRAMQGHYVLPGSLTESARLDPQVYSALPG